MQRDYIMRLIEQIAALMASIIAKERAGKYTEAKAEIDEKSRQTIGLSLEQVRSFLPKPCRSYSPTLAACATDAPSF